MSIAWKSLWTVSLCGLAWLVGVVCPTWADDQPACGCCGKQAADQVLALGSAEASAKAAPSVGILSGWICPIYIWANHGTYCDWYAMKCPENWPQSYPTSCSRPPATGCYDPNHTNCDAVGGEAPSVLKATNKHQGVTGYGQAKLKKKTKAEITARVLKSSAAYSTTYLADGVVAFPLKSGPSSPTVYAQIILASVTPTDKRNPPAVLATAYEIEPPSGGQADKVTVIDRPPGRPHATTVLWGSVLVDVITHEKTIP
jgi:hypothetical protein